MDYDEMLAVWRAQDKAPAYRVNPDLLQVVVWQEQANLRRQLFLGLWVPPCLGWVMASVMVTIPFALLFAATSRGWATPSVWDYTAAGIAIGVLLLWPVAYWVSHRRQALHESSFGNSLQDEIRRNLSRVDYQLSLYGRLAPSLLRFAPIWVAAILFFWVSVRMNDKPTGWLPFFIAGWFILWPVFSAGRYYEKRLLALRRRLNELLELLDAGEWKASEWEWNE
jgi:hypothetical protein